MVEGKAQTKDGAHGPVHVGTMTLQPRVPQDPKTRGDCRMWNRLRNPTLVVPSNQITVSSVHPFISRKNAVREVGMWILDSESRLASAWCLRTSGRKCCMEWGWQLSAQDSCGCDCW